MKTYSQKEVKILNQRIRRVAEKFGTDSTTYKEMTKNLINQRATHYTSKGIIQLDNTQQARENEPFIFKKAFTDIKTIKDIYQEYQTKDIKEIESLNEEFINAESNLQTKLFMLYAELGEVSSREVISSLTNLNNSYNTKQDIINAYKKIDEYLNNMR